MLFNDLHDFFVHKPYSSVYEMSQYFNRSSETMRFILKPFILKGYIKKTQSMCSKGCSSCSKDKLEIYYWVKSTKAKNELINLQAV